MGDEPTVETTGRIDEELAKILERYRPVSIEAERVADIPPRQWSIDGLIPRGELTLIGARKGLGKSWFALQAGAAIARGATFLGQCTFKGSVLYWPSELDRIGIHERSQRLGALPMNFDVMYQSLPRGTDFLRILPHIISGYRYDCIFLDMLQGVLPTETDSNAYEIGHFLLALRHIAMATQTAIVGSWHNGKADRDDPVLSLIGSTGIGAQAGSIITIDRKRGAPNGKIFVSGNHGKDRIITYSFNDGLFEENASIEGRSNFPRLAPADRAILQVVEQNPDGVTSADISRIVNKNPASVRTALARLKSSGQVEKINETHAWRLVGLVPSLDIQ